MRIVLEGQYRAPALRYWRLCEADLSDEDLAAASGVPVSTIHDLEAGGKASPAVIQQLTGALATELVAGGDSRPAVNIRRLDADQQRLLEGHLRPG